jgi:hypothetical protein
MIAGEKIFHRELSESMCYFLAIGLSISTKNRAMILSTAILVPEKKSQRLEPTVASTTRPLSSLVLTH